MAWLSDMLWRLISPPAILRFFFVASSPAFSTRRMPGASTANDFSMNTWQPLATAYSRWMGRKPGGVVNSTSPPGADRVDGLLVAVQADELPLLGHVDLLFELLRKGLRAGLEPVVEEVGHGPELRGALGAQGLRGGAGAAAAAADQGQFDRVVLAGIAAGGNLAQQGRAGQRRSGGFEELAAGS